MFILVPYDLKFWVIISPNYLIGAMQFNEIEVDFFGGCDVVSDKDYVSLRSC